MYTEAKDILLNTVGENHQSMARAYLNTGVYYEDRRLYKQAFENLYKWHLVLVELYGIEHTRTVRSLITFNEPFYRRICIKQGITIPPPPEQPAAT